MAIAGIDIGTSGLKVIIFGNEGNILYQAHRKYQEIREYGFRELSPVIVAQHVFSALEESIQNTNQKIAAIAVASLGESLVFLDQNDKVLCHSMVTGDVRGAEQALDIQKTFNEQKIMEITGLTPCEMYSLPKLMWMRQNTSVLDRTHKIYFFEDYIGYLLTGERKVSYTSAARSMAFDIRHKVWCESLLSIAELDESLFSDPVAPGTVIGTILPRMAARLHLSPDTIVVAGGHDQSLAALGGALIDPSIAEDGHGTCEFLSVMLPKNPDLSIMAEQDLPCSPYILPDQYLTGLEITTCGALMNWSQETIFSGVRQQCQKKNINFFEYMDQQAKNIRTDISVLPQFGSSGNPDINYHVTGTIAGLTLHTTLPDIYLGLKESLAFQMRLAYEYSQKAGISIQKLVFTGGGSSSRLTAQIRADVFRMPVYRLACNEAGAMGCMILSAVALGIYTDIRTCVDNLVHFSDEIVPTDGCKDMYEEKFQKYKQFYQYMHAPLG